MDGKPRLFVVPDDDVAVRRREIDRVEQLVAEGRSRLTAHRIVEIERELTEAGRARRRPGSQR